MSPFNDGERTSRTYPSYMQESGKTFSPRALLAGVNYVTDRPPLRAVAWQLAPGRRLVVLHSPHASCGITEYGRQLDTAFGLEAVVPSGNAASGWDVSAGDVLLVHYEPGIAPIDLDDHLNAALRRGAQVVLCCHYFAEDTLRVPAAIRVIHRQYGGICHPSLKVIPLACPVYTLPVESRAELRARFGLPQSGRVLTTLGFLVSWKKFPEVLQAVLGHTPPSVHVQLLCPRPFSHHDEGEEQALRDVIATAPSRVTYIDTFIPEREMLDRVYASDLGFRYTPTDTGSVSAATKQFISARCPVAVTASNHTSDLDAGVHRVGSNDVDTFAREIAKLSANERDLCHLSVGAAREYQRLNMDAVAKQYLELFGAPRL